MGFYTSCSVIRLDSFSPLTTYKFGKPFFPLKEIADGSSTLASQRGHCEVTNLSLRRFDGNKGGRHFQRTAASGRFRKRDDEKIQSSDSNSANQDEIISLFRRIQSSISKEESMTRKQNSKSSEEKPSADSVLEVLRQSRKQMKANTLNERGEKVLSIRRGQLKNDDIIDYHPSITDLKLTRPPSNFMKRSPIPTAPRSELRSKENKASPATGSENTLELEKVEEMKLSALKELAKSRGLKAYSKLKRSELITLLRS